MKSPEKSPEKSPKIDKIDRQLIELKKKGLLYPSIFLALTTTAGLIGHIMSDDPYEKKQITDSVSKCIPGDEFNPENISDNQVKEIQKCALGKISLSSTKSRLTTNRVRKEIKKIK